MSDTPVVGKIAFSSVANPNTWDIGESKCLVFASPSEAKRAEELFSAMQRDLTAALAKLSEVEAERDALKVRLEIDHATDGNGNRVPFPDGAPDGIACRDQTIKLLEERVDALKEDAERIDWLEEHAQVQGSSGLATTFLLPTVRADGHVESLRAALDAARKK